MQPPWFVFGFVVERTAPPRACPGDMRMRNPRKMRKPLLTEFWTCLDVENELFNKLYLKKKKIIRNSKTERPRPALETLRRR